MKRAWGYDHIMTKKTIKHASADVGFIFIAYNIKRILKIIGIDGLRALCASFYRILRAIIVKKCNETLKKVILRLNQEFCKHTRFSSFQPYLYQNKLSAIGF